MEGSDPPSPAAARHPEAPNLTSILVNGWSVRLNWRLPHRHLRIIADHTSCYRPLGWPNPAPHSVELHDADST
jgi:hypothetical protein